MCTNAVDIIEFRLTCECYGPDTFPTPTVEIYINNENLREKVYDVELPFAEADKRAGIAGHAGHATITPSELYSSLHDDYLEYDYVPIFGCGCGIVDCWPFEVAIDVGEKVVTWYGFNMYPRENWDYSKLGSFVFDKKQYFKEVDRLLDIKKQGREIIEKFQVSFKHEKYGWVNMYMYLEGNRCKTRLSCVFSPFGDLLNMLKNVEKGSSSEKVIINEEGFYTVIDICEGKSADILDITVIKRNVDDTINNHHHCNVLRKNFLQVFKWAFAELKDDGFDPNYWDEHEPDYAYNDEDVPNPLGWVESFWKDSWFEIKEYEGNFEEAVIERAKVLSELDNDTIKALEYMEFDDSRLKRWNKSKSLAHYQLECEKEDACHDLQQYDWFYNFEKYDYRYGIFDSKDINEMYFGLARKLANKLYEEVYEGLLEYAHDTESSFYGDYPTIWEQLKADERHGDPAMNEEELENACYEHLDGLLEHELYLLWVYLCEDPHSPVEDSSIDVPVRINDPQGTDLKNDIFQEIMQALWHAAEEENKDE